MEIKDYYHSLQEKNRYFNQGYIHLLHLIRNQPQLMTEEDYLTEDGFALGQWMKEIRKQWDAGELNKRQIAKLEAIGFAKLEICQNWEAMYRLVYDYFIVNGNAKINRFYRNDEGIMLGAWLDKQVHFFSGLTKEQQEKLIAIGVTTENDTSQ